MNKREQQLYQEHLTRLRVRLKDTELLHTPDGEVGPSVCTPLGAWIHK